MINLVKMSLTPGQVLLCTYHLKSDADILTMCLETLEIVGVQSSSELLFSTLVRVVGGERKTRPKWTIFE